MGWSYGYDNQSAKDVHKEVLDPIHNGPDLRVVKYASKAYGKRLWVRYERRSTGESFICLFLVKGGKEGWGYKDITEDMGPCEVDCPLSFLDGLSEPSNAYSKEWREKVREYWAKRKANHGKKFEKGDRVLINGYNYVVTGKSARSYFVMMEHGGGFIYRCGPMKMHKIDT